MATIDKQPLTSMNITEEQLLNFKQLFPEVFTEGLKVDWEKLKLTLGETVDTGKERYGMNWPGKADCFKTIQQPSIATLVPARDESIDFDTTENLFIEGDNLEVLKLLQKSYLGGIKFMYFDPPYNTGKEFIYPDNYTESLETYLEYTGQTNSDGKKFVTNTDSDGRFHSKWMNMMYPRLFLAKNLLTEDGVIFISIDDNEVNNLKALCNEIFGEENFIANVIWERSFSPVNLKKHFSENHDFILCFAKNLSVSINNGLKRSLEADARYSNPDNDPRGDWTSSDMTVGPAIQEKLYQLITPSGKIMAPSRGRCWLFTKDRYEEMLADNRIWFGESGENMPRVKKFLSEVKNSVTPMTIWKYSEVGHSQEAAQSLKKIFDGLSFFDYPKPVNLIKRCLEIYSDKNTIAIDIFAGSCTTAQAVMELNKEDGGNRKFICVQIPELNDEESDAFKAGYKSIADIGKERIRRVSAKIKSEIEVEKSKKVGEISFDELSTNTSQLSTDFGFKVFKLDKSNFKIWDATLEKEPEAIQQRLFEHIDHISPEAAQESILYELLLKSGFELTTPIEKLTLAEKTVFSIAGGQLLICLEKELSHDSIKAMAEMQPTRVICLDEAFTGTNADALKTNAVQIMKSKGVVNFRTV
jgi:adenine-specific DNA-methyltransferase